MRFAIPVIGFCVVLAAAGCSKSSDNGLDLMLKQTGQSRENIFPLAGKITIDGQVPHVVFPDRLLVMLNDPTNPILTQRPRRQCDEKGEFSFGTFRKGDGIRAGKYIVTFAILKITPQGLHGPDGLKNLYNDPDKNADIPEFNIVHSAPGKKDYVFDLKLEGRDGVDTPGPKALTELRTIGG
jgi:hypothetical protein